MAATVSARFILCSQALLGSKFQHEATFCANCIGTVKVAARPAPRFVARPLRSASRISSNPKSEGPCRQSLHSIAALTSTTAWPRRSRRACAASSPTIRGPTPSSAPTPISSAGAQVAVIDPGRRTIAHLSAIADATRGERVTHILITHSHRDHCDGARAACRRWSAERSWLRPDRLRAAAPVRPVSAMPSSIRAFRARPDARDGDDGQGAGVALDVLHTPGHSPDHLCFALVGQRTVFTGDHVMGWNTTVIAPPEGSMAKFLASLEKAAAAARQGLPAGPWRPRPDAAAGGQGLYDASAMARADHPRLPRGRESLPSRASSPDLRRSRRRSASRPRRCRCSRISSILISRGLVAADGAPGLSSTYFGLSRGASSPAS